jgi:hypothetical protein
LVASRVYDLFFSTGFVVQSQLIDFTRFWWFLRARSKPAELSALSEPQILLATRATGRSWSVRLASLWALLFQPQAGSTAVLVDEFDAGGLQGAPNSQVIGGRK